MRVPHLAFLAIAYAVPAAALDVPAPATLVATVSQEGAQYALPTAAFDGQIVPNTQIQGDLEQQVWQFSGGSRTLLQLTQPIAESLESEGYRKVLDCISDICGGFDFRFQVDVMPAPDMYVNLRNFQFQSFLKGPEDAPEQAVTVLASIAGTEGFLQITQVGDPQKISSAAIPTDRLPSGTDVSENDFVRVPQSLTEDLFANGAAALDGLEFETGATVLGAGPFDVLKKLAEFLELNPGINMVLVGHTDATGGFDGNVRISKARAEAVRTRLVESYGADASRLQAEGMGYLAPRASNLTEAGREANRRVEVVILSQNE